MSGIYPAMKFPGFVLHEQMDGSW